jgi:hypothetical protein
MKPTRLSAPIVAFALILQTTSCGQKAASQRTFADDVALRLAKSDLLVEAFSITNNGQQLGNVDMDVVMQPLEEPLDLKAARILVHGFADQSALENSARIFNDNFRSVTKNLVQVADLGTPNSRYTASFVDRKLAEAASSKDKSNNDKSDWPATLEKYSLEMLDSVAGKAALVKQTAQLLSALRSQENLSILEQFRVALSQALARHPEQLKPFTEEKPPSPAVRAAIDRLQNLLQSPAK